MAYNGPAIKGVSVAERLKAGAVSLNRGRILVPTVMSEAWRGFCHQVASFLSFTSVCHDRAYERHGVAVQRFIGSRSPVPLHRI